MIDLDTLPAEQLYAMMDAGADILGSHMDERECRNWLESLALEIFKAMNQAREAFEHPTALRDEHSGSPLS
jgi:hypothetical protein